MFCAVAFAFCLPGCLTVHDSQQGSQAARVYLTDRKTVAVLPPSALGRAFESYQQIEGSFRGETYFFDAYVHADKERLVIVAFNSLGTKVFELEHERNGVRFSTSLQADGMKPEYILEDFQLCFFPADVVKKNLEAADLSLTVSREGEGEIRTVSDRGRPIIEIRSDGGEIRYRNLLRGYQYIVKGN